MEPFSVQVAVMGTIFSLFSFVYVLVYQKYANVSFWYIVLHSILSFVIFVYSLVFFFIYNRHVLVFGLLEVLLLYAFLLMVRIIN